jgi:hypothetical protein
LWCAFLPRQPHETATRKDRWRPFMGPICWRMPGALLGGVLTFAGLLSPFCAGIVAFCPCLI